jgi:hypothetical protein
MSAGDGADGPHQGQPLVTGGTALEAAEGIKEISGIGLGGHRFYLLVVVT